MLFLCLLATMMLVSACFGRAETPTPTGPNLLETLPDDWMPVGGENIWKTIDIDGDEGEPEFLLFFTYDNRTPGEFSGPAGAVIFDLQNNAEYFPARQALAMPYQPSGSYIPYRALPNYWEGSGTGFIAPTGKEESIVFSTAVRSADGQTHVVEKRQPTDGTVTAIVTDTVKIKELLIEDQSDTVTVVWWRDIINGYGVASVYAAAGIEDRLYEKEGDKSTPLLSFTGRHPFEDRSELCSIIAYQRDYIEGVDIDFLERADGIDFCTEPPSIPFYPEAVVLKYLMADEKADLSDLADLRSEAAEEAADALRASIADGTQRIFGLFGPPSIRFGAEKEARATVCVEVLSTENGDSVAYNVHLIHVKPEVNASSTDQFRISMIRKIPTPDDDTSVDCRTIVPQGTPGRTPWAKSEWEPAS